ncbi:MAG: hypothetical protein KME60_27750 [Cyanomargarita calcarea GSE-NOS-MK-12-04C]|jgi:hypothetical protein|uniref:Baseplate protein J-like domain-containing protein n=1 Tax=Cyanomargarita calcarea GSE-NOS-MK-12-04C TaxID=2839659 RepID=A0A951UYM7_9CYAN|nr:hypothetical protein [Cyanomargarita calcarea GSE-NOS-MK-12-04C]
MSTDDQKQVGCRNDCAESLTFPKQVKNRPGLTHIDYRIGSYADIREFLLRRLDREPLLAAWTHREADDPGIALLEGAAILGDILTFYQDLYANEAYLCTAKWRDSIDDLVRLLGYHLSPGIGGKATFAFGVKGSTPVVIPASFPVKAQLEGADKPIDFETIREFIAEPAFSQFNLYRPFVHPKITNNRNTFAVETAKLTLKLEKGDRLMLVKDPTESQTLRQIVVIAEVSEKLDCTEIAIEGSWQSGNVDSHAMTAYKLGRSFRYFGYNAPPTVTVVVGQNATQVPVSFVADVHPPSSTSFKKIVAEASSFNSPDAFSVSSSPISERLSDLSVQILVSPVPPIYNPALANNSFPLDQKVDDISVGSTLLISLQLSNITPTDSDSTYFFAKRIALVSVASATHGALTGGTTVVKLDTAIGTDALRYTDIRSVEFQEVVGQAFTIMSTREADITANSSQLFYYGDGFTYKKLEERSLQLVQGQQVEQVTAGIDDTLTYPDEQITLRPLTIKPSLQKLTLGDFPLEKPPKVTVYGNLVEANQGKTEPQAVLGNGDNRQVFQTFKLPKAPLTYFNSKSETPPEVPELQIYVSDRLWKRVPSLFDRGSIEEIYIVREDTNGDSWVQFGDGKTGARLPSGLNNIVAKHRTGIGAYGALKPDTTVQGGKLERLDKIWLPDIATGGEQPETGDNAKEAAPGKVQSLGRLVTLQDFEQETLAIQGVSKVAAIWGLLNYTPMVMLTVLMERGREQEINEVQQILNTYNRCRGFQRFPIYVRPGNLRHVYLDVTIGIDPTFQQPLVKRAIQVAIGVTGEEGNGIDGTAGLFGLPRRRFGEAEYETRIAATLQNVEGVMWVKVSAFGFLLGTGDDPLTLKLPATKLNPGKLICENHEILSLHTIHFQPQFVTTISIGEC